MRKCALTLACSVLVLAGCSEGQEAAMLDQADSIAASAPAEVEAKEEADGIAENSDEASSNSVPTAPKIAYVYDYGFRIAADEIAGLTQKHIELCESMANSACRVLSLSQNGSEGDFAHGRLELAVAAGQARGFGAALAQSAEGLGGEQISAQITGEDLSRQMVDTEARLRARTALRDRLMDILRTRNGTVEELIAAERGVADVNQEIDQARSWLAEMRGRVAYSRLNITYGSGGRSAGSFGRPIAEALGSIGSILGMTIAALIYALTALIPIAILVGALLWLWRKAIKPLLDKPKPSEGPESSK